MKVISEYKLKPIQIETYKNKGYEVYYGYEDYHIRNGESVGFLLDTLYKSTIDTITKLLYRKVKSKITILYKGKTYNLRDLTDWTYSYTDLNTKRRVTVDHDVLLDYKTKRAEYFEEVEQNRKEKPIRMLLAYTEDKIPEDLDKIIETYAPLYDIQISHDSNYEMEDKLRAYQSIKWYLDNDIEYSRDVLGYLPTEEKMFDTISFGNEGYLEDYVYQNA